MRLRLSLLWLILATSTALSADPAWWVGRGVKTTAPAANLSPATIGQAKHMAAMALAELQGHLPAPALQALQTDLAAVVDLSLPDPLPPGFHEAQRAVLLNGQLKAIAKPFYDHLRTHNTTWLDNSMTAGNLVVMEPGSNPPTPSPYPWSEAATDDANRAPAILGQLKAVFSLPLETLSGTTIQDSDGDGMSDAWEIQNGFHPNDSSDGDGDFDGDGMTNLQEYQTGTNPHYTDSDGDGALDGDENDANTNPADPGSAPQEGWIVLTGDNAQGARKVLNRTITIPKGQTRIVMVALHSEEYPGYTEVQSEYNDTLEWNITPSGGTAIAGQTNVNDKHADWQVAEVEGTVIKNFTPVHIEKISSLTAPAETDLTVAVELAATNTSDGALPSSVMVGLMPVELAPEVLAVNSDFDEGRIDSVTGYAIPDCDDTNIALEAVENHLDGKFAVNERITDDLHPGFFGVNPSTLGDEFWAGANVTIRKIDKIDPATGHPESGHIRLYGKWGNGASEYRAIKPYDFYSLSAANLVLGGINNVPNESVYGTNSPFPTEAQFYIEGVHPGWITLEWRYVKGEMVLTHVQRFEVCTHKNAQQWKHDLAYKIRLETANDPSGQINVNPLMFPSESYKVKMERASEFYDFYQDCFLTPMRSQPIHPQAMTWPGLARLAGSQVVSGLSDSEYARIFLELGTINDEIAPVPLVDELNQWTLNQTLELQNALFGGARTIFQSIGWQMHAYRSSGYRALDWVAQNTNDPEAIALVEDGVWKDLRMGIQSHDKVLLDSVSLGITDREQNVTIQPTWEIIAELFLGGTNQIFSILGQNSCSPLGKDFLDVFDVEYLLRSSPPKPIGSLADKENRWDWIKPELEDGILDTWNKQPLAARALLVGYTLREDAKRFSLVYKIEPKIPILVWDHQDNL